MLFSASQRTGKTKRKLVFVLIFTNRSHAADFYQEQSVLRAQALRFFVTVRVRVTEDIFREHFQTIFGSLRFSVDF